MWCRFQNSHYFGVVKIVTVSGSFGSCVSRYVHLSHFKNTLLTYLLTAIRASFGKKLRAQDPKSLPPDAFPGLKICQNYLRPELRPGPRWGSLQRSRDPHSWINGGLLLRGGRGKLRPLSQIPGSARKCNGMAVPGTRPSPRVFRSTLPIFFVLSRTVWAWFRRSAWKKWSFASRLFKVTQVHRNRYVSIRYLWRPFVIP